MPRRDSLQREQDLAQLGALYLQGQTQVAIGEELGVSQPQICKDLATLQRRWLESALIDFSAAKAKELARIDHLERVYWEAWEHSTQERIRNVTEKVEAGGQERKRAQLEREPQSGNPAYLEGVRWCIDRRCKVLGLDAAARWEVTGKEGGPVQLQQEREYDPKLLAEWERLLLRETTPAEPAGAGA